jgi:hypothetical protein
MATSRAGTTDTMKTRERSRELLATNRTRLGRYATPTGVGTEPHVVVLDTTHGNVELLTTRLACQRLTIPPQTKEYSALPRSLRISPLPYISTGHRTENMGVPATLALVTYHRFAARLAWHGNGVTLIHSHKYTGTNWGVNYEYCAR